MVTHYMPPHIGGIEIVADNLFRAYKAAGFRVRWIASRVPSEAARYEDDRQRVRCLNWFESFGIPWPLWGPGAIRGVYNLIRWADILHVHDCLYPGTFLAGILGYLFKKPIIMTQHIGFVHYPKEFLNYLETCAYNSIGKVLLQAATSLVLATPAAEQFVRDLLDGLPVTATSIFNGIDTDSFQPATPEERRQLRRKFHLPEFGKVVLFVGRLVEKKGVDLFIEVCRGLPRLHFLMVGDGPLRPPALANLSWVPFMTPTEMPEVYRTANIFLLPSHGEGFPVSVQEAMATGLPVVISKKQPFGTLLEQEAAVLVADRIAVAFSETLIRLSEDHDFARNLGKRARELIIREWSVKHMNQKYIDLIEKTLILRLQER